MRGLLFLIAIGLCLAFLFVYVRNNRKTKAAGAKKTADASPKDAESEQKEATVRRLQGVIELCVAVKLKGEDEVLARLLGLADLLKDLLPRTNEKYPDKETTWRVNRMADGHLPKIINPYIELEPEQRDERRADLLALLDKMKKDLEDVADLLSQDNEMAYDSKARFLETAYNKI